MVNASPVTFQKSPTLGDLLRGEGRKEFARFEIPPEMRSPLVCMDGNTLFGLRGEFSAAYRVKWNIRSFR